MGQDECASAAKYVRFASEPTQGLVHTSPHAPHSPFFGIPAQLSESPLSPASRSRFRSSHPAVFVYPLGPKTTSAIYHVKKARCKSVWPLLGGGRRKVKKGGICCSRLMEAGTEAGLGPGPGSAEKAVKAPLTRKLSVSRPAIFQVQLHTPASHTSPSRRTRQQKVQLFTRVVSSVPHVLLLKQ